MYIPFVDNHKSGLNRVETTMFYLCLPCYFLVTSGPGFRLLRVAEGFPSNYLEHIDTRTFFKKRGFCGPSVILLMTHHRWRCWKRGSGSTSSPSSSPLVLAPCPDGAPPGQVGGTGPTDLQRLSWRVCCCCCCCFCSLCSCRHGGEVIRLWLPSLSLSFAFVDPSCTLPLAVPSFGIYRSSPHP